MTIRQHLLALADLGVGISVSGDKLIVEGNVKSIDPDVRAFLKGNKESIIDFLNSRSTPQLQTIPRSEGAEQPLSFSQQRLWLVQQMNPEGNQYSMPVALRLEGELNVDALHRALDRILERHAVLRTVFLTDSSGEPVQTVLGGTRLDFPVLDLSDDPQAEASASTLIAGEFARPFDLEKDVMLRTKLLRLSATSHILLINLHHIAADGWSMSVLTRELAVLYGAFCRDGEGIDPLPELPVQYSDFAAWQRKWFSGERLERHLTYWRSMLEGAPRIHDLPLDFVRPAVASFRGGRYVQRISGELKDTLNQLAQSHQATLFMLMNAAFATLLARYSNSVDIVIGTPIANRERTELAPLVGFFINTLIVRSDLSANPTFAELLEQSKDRLLGAYEHQQMPFERLIEEMQPERSLSYQPVVQILLSLHNNETSDFALDGLACQFLNQGEYQARYDITLNVTEQDTGILLLWEFATDLFKEDTIARMSHHFEELLRNVAREPMSRVLDINFHCAEDSLNLRTWNATRVEYDAEACIQQLFEQQVRKTPNAIAVECDGVTLSYLELNRKANQLAQYLLEVGVKANTLVGLCAERSIELVVAVFGILKAGAAYVPLEPSLPKARLQYLMSDAGIDLVLLQSHLAPKLPLAAADILLLDDVLAGEQWLPGYDDANPPLTGGADHLVYVIYTSGSTGKPKGVLINHRSLTNYLGHAVATYSAGIEAGVLSSTLGFDATVSSLFTPLLSGKKLLVVPQRRSDIEELAATFLSATQPMLFKLTPSHMEALLPLLKGVRSPLAHCLVIGGEQLSASLVGQWREQVLPEGRYINEYGPTEATVGCVVEEVEKPVSECSAVPIGRPILNMEMHVLDDYGNPAPIGVFGELYIAGDGLAVGYMNQAALTAERFPTVRLSDGRTLRLYKTGDRVRWLDSGKLEFAARLDHQVKLRGFRIELGEIESTALSHSAVTQCAVLVDPDQNQLVAFVVGSVAEDTRQDLSRHMGHQLPSFMLPARYIWLDELPLTSNGKVDRKALLVRSASSSAAATYEAPRDAEERALCEVWATVLKRSKVGLNDNFFSMGGDSIRVIQVIKLAQERGLQLAVTDVFAHQTVLALSASGLLKSVGSTRSEDAPLHLLLSHLPEEFKPPFGRDVYPVTSLQQLMLEAALTEGQERGVYHPQLMYDISGQAIDPGSLGRVCEHLVRKHVVLRTTFYKGSDGRYVQAIEEAFAFRIGHVDLNGISAEDQKRRTRQLIDDDSRNPFIPDAGEPLIRITLITLSATSHCLFVSMHHAIEDGWGFVELMNELTTLYSQLVLHGELPSESATNVFKERVALELEAGASLESQAAWEEALAGYTPMPPLVSRECWREDEINEIEFELNGEAVAGLRSLTQHTGAPVKNVLLLAYMNALAGLSGSNSITVDVVTNGRSTRLSDPLKAFGLFWNLLPVNLALSRQLDGDLKTLGERLLQIDAHSLYPADRLTSLTGTKDPTYAAFNFVSYHHAAENRLSDNGFSVSLGHARDRFHHAIKLFASLDGNEASLFLKIEFSRQYISPGQAQSFREAFLGNVADILSCHKKYAISVGTVIEELCDDGK